MKLIASISLLSLLLLVGCSTHAVMIYEAKGDQQCGYKPGKTITESARKLENEGIVVIESFCGVKHGFTMAMCGGPTLNILLHHIDEKDLESAEKLGFKPVTQLHSSDNKPEFDMISCE